MYVCACEPNLCHPSPPKGSLWPGTLPHLHAPLDGSQSAGCPATTVSIAPDRSPPVQGRGHVGIKPVCVCDEVKGRIKMGESGDY